MTETRVIEFVTPTDKVEVEIPEEVAGFLKEMARRSRKTEEEIVLEILTERIEEFGLSFPES